MSTQKTFLNSENWTDLTTLFNFALDDKFILQNTGPNNIYLFENSTIPNINDTGIVLRPTNDIFTFKQAAEFLYARVIFNGRSVITISAGL